MNDKILTTKNYSIFRLIEDNRKITLNTKVRKELRESMSKYGWWVAHPMDCTRLPGGQLLVRDGQHRLQIAQELGISVRYVVSNDNIDVADINRMQVPWKVVDYAERYAKQGNEHYKELLSFCEEHKIAMQIGIALLFGNMEPNNAYRNFKSGGFKVKDRGYANVCVRIYNLIREYAPESANRNAMAAIQACVRVPGFDVSRMIAAIKRRFDLLKRYGTRDAYLDVFQDIYNDHVRKNKCVPLKFNANQCLASRNIDHG
jgi:hypothetical protein